MQKPKDWLIRLRRLRFKKRLKLRDLRLKHRPFCKKNLSLKLRRRLVSKKRPGLWLIKFKESKLQRKKLNVLPNFKLRRNKPSKEFKKELRLKKLTQRLQLEKLRYKKQRQRPRLKTKQRSRPWRKLMLSHNDKEEPQSREIRIMLVVVLIGVICMKVLRIKITVTINQEPHQFNKDFKAVKALLRDNL